MLLKRQLRRVKGYCWSFLYTLRLSWVYILYRCRLWREGESERYIREAFSYLVQLDLDDWHTVGLPEGYRLKFTCLGDGIHLFYSEPSRTYECVVFESRFTTGRPQIVVHEWREREREVRLEWDSLHKTHWFEVFRSGKTCESVKFVTLMRFIYGKCPVALKLCEPPLRRGNHAVQVDKPATLFVCKTPQHC